MGELSSTAAKEKNGFLATARLAGEESRRDLFSLAARGWEPENSPLGLAPFFPDPQGSRILGQPQLASGLNRWGYDGTQRGSLFPQSLNLYSYARNNPVTNTDPDGHDCCFGWFSQIYDTVFNSFTAPGWRANAAPPPPQCSSDPCTVTADAPETLWERFDPAQQMFTSFTDLFLNNKPAAALPLALSMASLAGGGEAEEVMEASAGAKAGEAAIDANKLHHIFDDPGHGLDAVVSAYGSQENAYAALQAATESAVRTQGLTGEYETTVQVGGQSVTVTGVVINGTARIGTAYIPKP